MKFFTPPMQRLLAGLALVAAFLVMASVFVPMDTDAEPAIPLYPHELYHPPAQSGDDAAGRLSVDPHEDLRSIGSIEQGCYIVFIYATEGGPRYTIYDRDEGREVAALLSAERVQELFPELPLPEIDFSAPVQLMYVPMNTNGY